MISSQEVEIAESKGQYTIRENIESGLTLSRTAENAGPNAYALFEELAQYFTESGGRVEPTMQVVHEERISGGHIKNAGRGPNEKVYDITLEVYVDGFLEVNESGEVIGGDMEVMFNYYR